jgi:hypothetical protein
MGWDDFHLHQFDVLDDTKDESRVTLARLRRRRRRLSPRRFTPEDEGASLMRQSVRAPESGFMPPTSGR